MKYDYKILVIGAGSAGLVVAGAAATLGAKTALIEQAKMGGDCLNYGCVPSKTFLKSAHLMKDIKQAQDLGINVQNFSSDIKSIMDRVNAVIEHIKPHDSFERFKKMGVEVLTGHARLTGRNAVTLNGKTITAKKIIIAAGSGPLIPDLPGLDKIPFLTNENIFELDKLPEHLIVLGAGPIGLELGQGFLHLGSNVSIIDRNSYIFKKDEPEVSQRMEKILSSDGIKFHLKSKVSGVSYSDGIYKVEIDEDGIKKTITGDRLLVSLGRKPSTNGLGLEETGIKTDKRGFVITNKFMQTNISNIYACGDVTGPYLFTHMAGYQAGIVVRNALFPFNSSPDYRKIAWTTYTKPEVAHVGYTEQSAKDKGVFTKSIFLEMDENDRAVTEKDTTGFAKFILDKKGRLLGATIVGEKGGEIISAVSLAISKKLKLSDFSGVIFSYPTQAEIIKQAATKNLKESIRPWQKKLLKKIL